MGATNTTLPCRSTAYSQAWITPLCDCMTARIACSIWNPCLDLCAAAHDVMLQWQLLYHGNVMFMLFAKPLRQYLREPPCEVVHDDCSNEGLAKPGGQADQRVLQQRCVDDVYLVCPFRHRSRVHPVLCIGPAAQSQRVGALLDACTSPCLHNAAAAQRVPLSVLACCETYDTALSCSLDKTVCQILCSVDGK